MTCPHSQRIDAFHDGELAAGEAAQMERHLAECHECRQELAQLRAVSALFASAKAPQLSSGALKRLHQVAGRIGERSILRIAEWMTAAAAAVLLIGLMGLFRDQPARVQPAAPWERVVVTLQVDSPSVGGETLQVAQWMTSGLNARGIDE